MVSISGSYRGGKRVAMVHGPSNAEITTSAPKDNNGDGLLFSPTDLVAAALGSCVLTTVAIVAERNGIDLTGSHFSVEKIMSTGAPRRIAELPLTLHLPKSVPEESRSKLEQSARTCPVKHSLHPEVKVYVEIAFDV